MPLPPRFLAPKLPRSFSALRRKPSLSLPPHRRSSSSRSFVSVYRSLPRPAQRFIFLLALFLTFFYLPSLFGGHSSSAHPLDDAKDGRARTRFEQHSWLKEGSDGSVTAGETEWKQGHPIRLLMAEAKQKWEDQLSRQSKTLAEAVQTYKLRYGRSPPKGFEDWWKFTQRNNVLIVDDYDQIHTSITPFLGLSPKLLGDRLTDSISGYPFFYEIQVRRNRAVKIAGKEKDSPRALEVANLIEGFRRFLPEDFGEGSGLFGHIDGDRGMVKLSVSDPVLGTRIMGEEFRDRMMDLAKRGRYVGEDVLRILENTKRDGAWADGLLKACSWKSLAKRTEYKEISILVASQQVDPTPNMAPISFIKDAVKSFNFCHNPSIIPLHGTYAQDIVRSNGLQPQFVLSKVDQSPQILMPSAVGFENETLGVTSWEEKPLKKIFWRGSTTGGAYKKTNDFNWRDSHRVRLNALVNNPRAEDKRTDVLVDAGPSETPSMRRLSARALNDHLFDVGLTKVVQCDEDDGTCDEMDEEIELVDDLAPLDTAMYRYVIDIDGNAWSTGFRRLLALGKAVFEITIYPEWNSEWLTPWLHYIPVNLDLSDLYHSSTFFLGAPGVSEGNDDEGKIISKAGQDFVENHWRWEDMQAYMFRLLLEYRRAMARDRDAMSMGGKMLL